MRTEVTFQRPEVISLRLSAARVELLERYRRVSAVELGRDVSLSEAAFLALEDRAAEIDRAVTRVELLKTPTESLYKIRRQWEAQHALSAAEWDVLAEYVRIGAEEDRHDPPAQPAIPSRDSYVALLDAFRAVYEHRADATISRHTWTYLGNLGEFISTPTAFAEQAPDQEAHLLLNQVAERRQRLLADSWERPGNVGHCLWVALREEGVESTTLDHVLAPHWVVLWRLAARGHWIRHAHRPVRVARSGNGNRWTIPPEPLSADEFTLSFGSATGGDLILSIASRSRGFGLDISHYPELAEFRVLLETTDDRWIGRYYSMTGEAKPPAVRRVRLTRRRSYLDFSKREWIALTDLVRARLADPRRPVPPRGTAGGSIVIHDNLIQHFHSLPEPQLSARFSTQLRQRLEAARRPGRGNAAAILIRRWAPRVFWIAATALVIETVRPPAFSPEHMAVMAVVGLLGVMALQRALRPTTLTRILRDALR